MTARESPPKPLVTLTVRLPADEVAALANAVYVVTSWQAINAAERAVKAVQNAAKNTVNQEAGR